MKKGFSIIIALLAFNCMFGQCPNTDFLVSNEGCIDQRIVLNNNTTSADSYFWSLCEDNLLNPDINLSIADNAGFFRAVYSVNHYSYENRFYSFVIRNNGLAYRYENDFLNNSIGEGVDLNSSDVDFPRDFKVIKKGSEYFGIITNSKSVNPTLVGFGNDLLNDTPTFSPIPLSSNIFNTNGLEFFIDQGGAYALLGSNNINKIYMLEFEDGMALEPAVTTYTVDGALSVQGISLIKECGTWKGLLTSRDNSKIFRVVFNSGLSGAPSITEITISDSAFNNPAKVKVVRENGFYYAFIQMDQGKIFRLDFGNSMDNSPTYEAIDALSPNCYGLDVIQTGQGWRLTSVDYANSTKGLFGLAFSSPCNETTQVSTDFEPTNLILDESGIAELRLTATSDNGEVRAYSQTITVTPNTAPDIDFSSQNVCQSAPIQFTSGSSSSGLTYFWDFGDSGTSTNEAPAHTYASSGDYEVTLEVSDGTCSNFVKDTITVYDEPLAGFTAPPGTICTNQQVTFVNETPGDYDGNESYEWQLDGNTIATTRDLTDYEFAESGPQELKLIVAIPGCTDEYVQNINITEGASPNFTVENACLGTLLQFNNTTPGEVVGYTWDFGNGFSSNNEVPAPFSYAEAGNYQVALTAQNSAGCVTTVEKEVTVYDLPQVNFLNELACEGLNTIFTDLTTVDNANIESWEWDFDDPGSENNHSDMANPIHVFSGSGEFDVKLKTFTTFGCVDSTEHIVHVRPAPVADFTYDKACLDESIQFADLSSPVEGENITSYAWDLGGEFSSSQNPSITFDDTRGYDVSLTVASENLCTNTVYKNITIHPGAEVSFETTNNCVGQRVVFNNTTTNEGDPLTAFNWDFSGMGMATGQTAAFQFGDEEENYDVTLEVMTASGCAYSNTQTVELNAVPGLEIIPSATFGAPPLTVDFVAAPEGLSFYEWDFDDNSTSNASNVSHTFEDVNAYDVRLVGTNASGCSDTVTQAINVLYANIDVEIVDLEFEDNQLSLLLRNNGNLNIDNAEAVVQLGYQSEIAETITATIPARLNESDPEPILMYELNIKINSYRPSFICVNVDTDVSGLEDVNLSNNSQCINLANSVIFNEPYPNPATDELTFKMVSEGEGTIIIQVYDASGSQIDTFDIDGKEGENVLSLDVSSLKDGMYWFEVIMNGESRSFRVAVD